MTASGVKFGEKMMRLANRVAPIRFKRKREIPADEPPAGPKLVEGRGRGRPRRRWRHPARQIVEIVVVTLVVYALWSLWNYGIWGWW